MPGFPKNYKDTTLALWGHSSAGFSSTVSSGSLRRVHGWRSTNHFSAL